MENTRPLRSIPDDELLHRLAELMGQSRRVEADIVAHIAEVEQRRLYAREAFPSMFVYCMDALHLSEAEAYLRILAARASRAHPILLTMLTDGRLHLTAIVKLAPHLTVENRDGLLERATHRSKRQIVELVAEIAPRPDAPVMVRKLPERRALPLAGPLVVPRPGDGLGLGLDPDLMLAHRPDAVGGDAPTMPASPSASAPLVSRTVLASRVSPAVVEPLSPGRYKVQFTASAEFRHKLERLQCLMGSKAPGGDLAAVIEQAVTEKLERLEARRFAQTKAPRKGLAEPRADTQPDRSPSSRHIPAAIRRAVSQRDGDRCCYVDEQGRRCPERNRLEYHHRRPFGLGGEHSVANLCLLCPAHNAYMAECDYGSAAMARHRSEPSRTAATATGQPKPSTRNARRHQFRSAVPESPA